jgi:ankyrin repeat protein
MKTKTTLLHKATTENDKQEVERLLKEGANVNSKNSDGETPLHKAVSAEMAELLISAGADMEAIEDHENFTPLRQASANGALDVVKTLISRGAKVDSADKNGSTALHWAVAFGNLPVAELLLSKGANPNAKAANTCEEGDTGVTPLFDAITCDDVGSEVWSVLLIDLLLRNGADVNARDKDGETPLFKAVREQRPDTVWFLLEHGADPTLRNMAGSLASELATGDHAARIKGMLQNRST